MIFELSSWNYLQVTIFDDFEMRRTSESTEEKEPKYFRNTHVNILFYSAEYFKEGRLYDFIVGINWLKKGIDSLHKNISVDVLLLTTASIRRHCGF